MSITHQNLPTRTAGGSALLCKEFSCTGKLIQYKEFTVVSFSFNEEDISFLDSQGEEKSCYGLFYTKEILEEMTGLKLRYFPLKLGRKFLKGNLDEQRDGPYGFGKSKIFTNGAAGGIGDDIVCENDKGEVVFIAISYRNRWRIGECSLRPIEKHRPNWSDCEGGRYGGGQSFYLLDESK